jgi:hypothetical protein
MKNLEIFALVKEKKGQLETLVDPTSFVLNPEAEKLQQEIYNLQQQCSHDFYRGKCKYCELEETV